MPEIFDTEDQTLRDRRMTEDTLPVAPAVGVPQEVIEQTLSPAEDTPQTHSATLQHPEHHVGTNEMHMFSAYCERPDHVTFETQENGEEILLLLRKSFITNIPWIFFSVSLALIPPIFLGMIDPASTPLSLLPPPYRLVLLFFYYLIIASYVLVSFITWYFNTSLITNMRIVDVDFSDLVYKNIAETKMDLIQDVSYTQASVIHTVFNYGDVLVQTAGSLENFDLFAVPHPDRAVEIIESLIGKGRVIGV